MENINELRQQVFNNYLENRRIYITSLLNKYYDEETKMYEIIPYLIIDDHDVAMVANYIYNLYGSNYSEFFRECFTYLVNKYGCNYSSYECLYRLLSSYFEGNLVKEEIGYTEIFQIDSTDDKKIIERFKNDRMIRELLDSQTEDPIKIAELMVSNYNGYLGADKDNEVRFELARTKSLINEMGL